VTLVLTAEDESRTRVDVTTDLTITGKAAQFGRGVMQDVASRLVDQFASNLETVIAARSGGADSSAADSSSGASADGGSSGGDSFAVGTNEGSATTPASPPAPIQQAEALDLGSVAAAPVLKRVVPVAIGLVVVVALIWWVVR
ncbi:MAG: carbon monoxide dehydrogenase, partial [Actinomycetota bacterium]|nr:carbon monoxide dehydrogenase [Actinomycetota bacterium]